MKSMTLKAVLALLIATFSFSAFANKTLERCSVLADNFVEDQLAGKVDDDDIFTQKCSQTRSGSFCYVTALTADRQILTYAVELNIQCTIVESAGLVEQD